MAAFYVIFIPSSCVYFSSIRLGKPFFVSELSSARRFYKSDFLPDGSSDMHSSTDVLDDFGYEYLVQIHQELHS